MALNCFINGVSLPALTFVIKIGVLNCKFMQSSIIFDSYKGMCSIDKCKK